MTNRDESRGPTNRREENAADPPPPEHDDATKAKMSLRAVRRLRHPARPARRTREVLPVTEEGRRFWDMRSRARSLQMLIPVVGLTLWAYVLERLGSPGFGKIAAITFGTCFVLGFVLAPYTAFYRRQGGIAR